jgi:hypothetical protein
MDVRQPHWATFIGEHTSDGIRDPARTAITLPLALDGPWLRIAGPKLAKSLDQVGQPGAVSGRQDLRNFCHKIARSTRMLVR